MAAVGSAYTVADLLSGSALVTSLALNSANLASVLCGVLALRAGNRGMLEMRRPVDAIYAVVIMAAASAGGGVAGAILGPLLFEMNWAESFNLWFTTEFVNYAIIVPVAVTLAMPQRGGIRLLSRHMRVAWRQVAALATLAGSIAITHLSGGPGAIAFVIPALLWCAVRFPPAVVTMLTLATCTWQLIAGPLGLIPLHFDLATTSNASSYRLGVAAVAIGPFAVVVLNAAWRTAHIALIHTATHDALTGLRNRGAFMQAAELAANTTATGKPICVLMIDIDRFKSINDAHGHATGDTVIGTVGDILLNETRDGDLSGRIGGEEFAVILPDTALAAGQVVAERLRQTFGMRDIASAGGNPLRATISIGLVEWKGPGALGEMLSAADAALYAAKHAGRDRVVAVAHSTEPA